MVCRTGNNTTEDNEKEEAEKDMTKRVWEAGQTHWNSKADWETPPDLFAALDAEFHFDIDVCATSENTKCERYYAPDDDAFFWPWTGTCWMNPPYSRGQIGRWMQRAFEESQKDGCRVVALVHARTDTRWFQAYGLRAVELRFIADRLRFHHPDMEMTRAARSPSPSVVIIFDYYTGVPPLARRMFQENGVWHTV